MIQTAPSPYAIPGLPAPVHISTKSRAELEVDGIKRTFQLYQEVVARINGRTPEELKIRRRFRTIVQPRQLVMAMAENILEMTQAQIGLEMGYFDHATINHSKRVVRNLYATSRGYREMVGLVIAELALSDRQVKMMGFKYTQPC